MNRRENELVAKVLAINLANATANELQPIFMKAFEPFLGKSIEKNDGSLLAKVEKIVPETKRLLESHVYRLVSQYSLAYVVKTCKSYPDGYGCVYHETVFYVGQTLNGFLTKLNDDFVPFRADYTVAEILAKRKAVEQAKTLLSNAQSELYPFSEF